MPVNSSELPEQPRRRPAGRASARGRRAARSRGGAGRRSASGPGRPSTTAPPRVSQVHSGQPWLWPCDQRQHERGERADDQHGLDDVRTRGVDPGVGQQPRRGHERGEADRHVDQEDRPPAGAGEVEVDQQPADQLAGGGGHPHDRGVGAERADPLRAGVHVADEGEHGRRDHGRRGALRQPRGEQRVHVGGEAADGRAEHEQARCRAGTSVGGPSGRRAGWPPGGARRR